jgi:hypothetical protein
MGKQLQIEIKHLIDCQEYIPSLATLLYEEVGRHWIDDASIEKTKMRLLTHLNKDTD